MDLLPLVTIRPISPRDVARMRDLLGSLSAETKYQRFQQAVHDFTDQQWRYLTCVDGHHHVALVGCMDGRIVGVCRFIRDRDDPEIAEVAFVVRDDVQRRGIGRRLRDALVERAKAVGIRRFRAFVLPQNMSIRRLLSSGGLALTSAGSRTLETTFCDVDQAAE